MGDKMTENDQWLMTKRRIEGLKVMISVGEWISDWLRLWMDVSELLSKRVNEWFHYVKKWVNEVSE